MKKNFTLLLLSVCFSLTGTLLLGQHSNVILFTENGERFSVILNGILQNDTPLTNVKITDLTAPSYKMKILFEDKNLPELNKTLMLSRDLEMTYCIKKNNKGIYVIRFQNQVDIHDAPSPVPAQVIIPYSINPPSTSSTVVQNQSTTMNIGNVNNVEGNITINVNTEATSKQTTNAPDHYVMPGYSGPIGCPWPITDLNFNHVLQTISDKSFEESKLEIAKQVTRSNCLFASEVKAIMELFSFENTKLDFAKFAYQNTYDLGNYYMINDAFHFEGSIKELNEYIQGRPVK